MDLLRKGDISLSLELDESVENRNSFRVSFLGADVSARALALDAATVPPAPNAPRGGRPAAAVLPSLGSALLQARVSRHGGAAHVGGLLGSLPGTKKKNQAVGKNL